MNSANRVVAALTLGAMVASNGGCGLVDELSASQAAVAMLLQAPSVPDPMNPTQMIAGPTTLTALLNSLQMGFRTLAIEKRSSEVWQVLGAVKTEFGKFGDVLAKTKSQLETVTRSIEAAEVRTRAMNRKLRDVEALPGEQATGILGDALAGSDADEP